MPRTHLDAARFVLDSIRSFGVTPHPASRLVKMYQLLLEEKFISPQHPRFSVAQESIRDFLILEFVFEKIKDNSKNNELLHLVKRLVSDSELPQENIERSPGRDAQVELYVAAICRASALRDVSLEEPDVTCYADDIKFGIAVKRIKSLDKLESRIRKASEQIEKSKLPGIIAIDTCVALNPDNERILNPIPDHEFGAAYRDMMHAFARYYEKRFLEWTRAKGVRGIMVHDHVIRQDTEPIWCLDGMSFGISTARENQRRQREFALFLDAYLWGIPNLQRL